MGCCSAKAAYENIRYEDVDPSHDGKLSTVIAMADEPKPLLADADPDDVKLSPHCSSINLDDQQHQAGAPHEGVPEISLETSAEIVQNSPSMNETAEQPGDAGSPKLVLEGIEWVPEVRQGSVDATSPSNEDHPPNSLLFPVTPEWQRRTSQDIHHYLKAAATLKTKMKIGSWVWGGKEYRNSFLCSEAAGCLVRSKQAANVDDGEDILTRMEELSLLNCVVAWEGDAIYRFTNDEAPEDRENNDDPAATSLDGTSDRQSEQASRITSTSPHFGPFWSFGLTSGILSSSLPTMSSMAEAASAAQDSSPSSETLHRASTLRVLRDADDSFRIPVKTRAIKILKNLSSSGSSGPMSL